MTTDLALRNERIVREIYDAALRLDMTVLERHLAPHVRLVEPASHPVGRTLWEGPAEFMAGLYEVFGLLRLERLEFHDVLSSPQRVAGVLDVVTLDAAGAEVRVPLVEVFTFDPGGRIVEIRPYYFDMVAVRRLVGADRPQPSGV